MMEQWSSEHGMMEHWDSEHGMMEQWNSEHGMTEHWNGMTNPDMMELWTDEQEEMMEHVDGMDVDIGPLIEPFSNLAAAGLWTSGIELDENPRNDGLSPPPATFDIPSPSRLTPVCTPPRHISFSPPSPNPFISRPAASSNPFYTPPITPHISVRSPLTSVDKPVMRNLLADFLADDDDG
ncbi:hypothetical protein BC829DRAFT_395345 [Chytridium lagenaria]|nr:hypothetical protein BC829DRAFT_395345 [Chytridium lagenaria]